MSDQSYFQSIKQEIPTIIERMDYATTQNFTGSIVPGYNKTLALATKECVLQLKKVSQELEKNNLSFVIYDAYRPMQAVEYFYNQWKTLEEDVLLKNKYYPTLTKKDLFEIGYLSTRSTHCRGSTVDIGLYDLKNKKELDFGSIFDFFGELSHTHNQEINSHAKDNRNYLLKVMETNGFKNYDKEWWHFTLDHEPFPDKYFNFEIKDNWNE